MTTDLGIVGEVMKYGVAGLIAFGAKQPAVAAKILGYTATRVFRDEAQKFGDQLSSPSHGNGSKVDKTA